MCVGKKQHGPCVHGGVALHDDAGHVGVVQAPVAAGLQTPAHHGRRDGVLEVEAGEVAAGRHGARAQLCGAQGSERRTLRR